MIVCAPVAAQGAEQPVELEAGYELDTLTKGLPSWSELYLDGKRQLADRAVIYGTARHTRRFALDDNELALGDGPYLSRSNRRCSSARRSRRPSTISMTYTMLSNTW